MDELLGRFTERWERGEAPRAEEYLPLLDDDDGVELIYKEFCLREADGEQPNLEDFARRFPHHQDRLRRLLGIHTAVDLPTLNSWVEPVRWPDTGDAFGPYRLLRQLGQGGFARVFLAEQEDLENRLVIIKITPLPSPEPRLMARVRHRYVLEVLRHGQAEQGMLEWVCMPFLGGATLADVLNERRRRGDRPAAGRDLLTLLDRVSAPEYPDSGLSRPAREILSSLSHARAVAWIIARLAEALGHAYRLGVTHGDLKPSNILLTADGEPMLLDFNLAVDWRSTHGAERVHESGTLAYMAPERLRAIGDPSRTPPRAGDRHRADIYSLGLVLLETLTGRAPTVPDGPDRSPRAIASALAEARGKEVKRSGWPAIPPSLRPILSRCLAADPADRYSSALHLAEDLDRWRTDLAPIHAPAPPGHMDLMRWARRQRVPLIAAALTLATGILSASIASIWSAETSRRLALEKLRITRTNSELGGFRYRLPGRWTPISSGDPVKLANARLKHYHVLDPTVDWRTRDDVRALPERERDELEAWVLEQAWRLSLALEVRSDDPENLKRALRDLERVAGLRTAGPIERRLRALRRRLGWPESPPRSVSTAPPWMEAYLRGVELEDHFPGEAAACFRQALAERPGFYWAQHHLASVLGRLGGNLEAAAYLRHCVERYPDCAWLRQEMGTRLLVLGQLEEAREQFDLAAVLDPDLDVAYRDRLLVRARLGQLHETQADLIRFASLTRPPGDSPPVHLRLLSARFLQNRLLASQLSEEESAQIHEAARAQPHDVELGIWSAIRFQLAGKNQEAFDEWNRIHQLEPNNLYIRYYRAYMLRYFDKTTSAQEMREILADRRFEELLALAPDVKRIFHMAAFDAFHDGRPADTVAIAQRGLELLKGDLEDLTLTGTLHYAIANALMVPSPGDPGDADIERIASHLNQAFRDRPDLLPHYAEADNKLSDPVMDRIRPLLRLRSPSSL